MNLVETARNIFAVPDLRKRIIFTFLLLAVYRLGSHIPTPGVDPIALSEFFKAMSGGVFGFLDLFSGGALRMTRFGSTSPFAARANTVAR